MVTKIFMWLGSRLFASKKRAQGFLACQIRTLQVRRSLNGADPELVARYTLLASVPDLTPEHIMQLFSQEKSSEITKPAVTTLNVVEQSKESAA